MKERVYKRRAWSKEEDAILLERYSKEGLELKVLLPNRTSAAILCRASFLDATEEPHWDETDLRILRERYCGEGPSTALQELLQRTKKSIKGKANALGLRVVRNSVNEPSPEQAPGYHKKELRSNSSGRHPSQPRQAAGYFAVPNNDYKIIREDFQSLIFARSDCLDKITLTPNQIPLK